MNGVELLQNIKKAKDANISLFDESYQRLSSFVNVLQTAISQSNSLPSTIPSQRSQSFKPSGPLSLGRGRQQPVFRSRSSSVLDPSVTDLWKKIGKLIFISDSFKIQHAGMKEKILPELKRIRNEYNESINGIEEALSKAINNVSNEERAYQKAHKSYMDLCEAIEKSHHDPAGRDTFNQLKFEFKKVQNQVVNQLNELNKTIINYNQEVEKILSDFENADKQRDHEFNELVKVFASLTRELSQVNNDLMEQLRREVNSLNSRKDVDAYFDEKELENQEIQTFNYIAPKFGFNIGSILSPQEIFEDELSKYIAELTENEENYKKGQEFIVIGSSDERSIVLSPIGKKIFIPSSKLQCKFKPKLMKVTQKTDEGELPAEVDDIVLVFNENSETSSCLNIYREEGIISSSKLTSI